MWHADGRQQTVTNSEQVLKVIEKHTDVSFNFQEHLFGGVSRTR